MGQVSRPLQVVLVGALLFGAVWLVALRPKTGSGSSAPPARHPAPTSTSPATGPGSSLPGSLGRAVTKARGAAGQSDAANQNLQQAAGGQAAATAQPAPITAQPPTAAGPTAVGRSVGGTLGALPSRATASPTAVREAMSDGKVVVLLFFNPRGADDQLVRGELGQVSTHGGRAFIVSAPVREVSRFDSVTRGVQVLQSPTVLVIDRAHHARTLVGYTDRAEIGQWVSAAVAAR
jgi:hypothetical protein